MNNLASYSQIWAVVPGFSICNKIILLCFQNEIQKIEFMLMRNIGNEHLDNVKLKGKMLDIVTSSYVRDTSGYCE